ncbi:MAG: glycoside hydrolase family 52 protein [Verrucomicrobiota bacterium]|nr:glycoside hydrolase family 52 protein [Verrucomicrobiota bacterium]
MHSIDFHAHHAAPGAYLTFTCGRWGAGGGLSVMGAQPAAQELLIGMREVDGNVHVLPFARQSVYQEDLGAFGDTSKPTAKRQRNPMGEGLHRHYTRGTDRWTWKQFAFTILTPNRPMPDPERDGPQPLARASLPAIVVRLELDNRESATERELIFAIGPGRGCHRIHGVNKDTLAVGWGSEYAIATAVVPGVRTLLEHSEFDHFDNGREFRLASMAGFTWTVPAGAHASVDLVLVGHRRGPVTTGMESSFFYTRAYATLESVIADALLRLPEMQAEAIALDADHRWLALDANRRFLHAHAEKSYWGNTWLLERAGDPLWCVLEGEYAMMNTFDLTVDMVFYELERNPWTVRNVLDLFFSRYSYTDTLARPPENCTRSGHGTFDRNPHHTPHYVPAPAETGLPGGLSFNHDMGVGGHFTEAGYSSYEAGGLQGCFSYMTAEQLLNWILCATSYVSKTGDKLWLQQKAPVFRACLTSLLNRDDPVPARRNGVVGLDSSRCDGGWEITTYDSLDASLGQARNNLYLAVKGWAAWLGLEQVLLALDDESAAREARAGAYRAATTIVSKFDDKLGYIPAVFEGGNTSAIIPAIEGLAFPLVWNRPELLSRDGAYGPLILALERHLRFVLSPERCLFPDGGWKLSSTSDNSWVSKIFLCQVVSEKVFGIIPSPASHSAHVHWEQVGSKDWAMSDQMMKGVPCGSRYYPRCVTADLWLQLG